MNSFEFTDRFEDRHVGVDSADESVMLKSLGHSSLHDFVDSIVPSKIKLKKPLDLPSPKSERGALEELRKIASQNKVFRSFIGLGYHDTITPAVIQRNILENPGWYTQYTPYQAEISQGRLEALLNFQTMIADLTGLPIANASLLDEGTAAAEAMLMSYNATRTHESLSDTHTFFVSKDCHPQTIAIVETRAAPFAIKVVIADHATFDFKIKIFGALLQYPASTGATHDYSDFIKKSHDHGALVTLASDILALTLLKSPGEMDADIAVGSTQRFGVPIGFGGPHAAYMATKDVFKRLMPGRIVGMSVDTEGRPAIRLALQTREQHIRREKATSNICTAQVLLAVTASMYAVYHGPKGLKNIASRIHALASTLALGLEKLGCKLETKDFFDTITVTSVYSQKEIKASAIGKKINLCYHANGRTTISLDETTTSSDIDNLFEVFNAGKQPSINAESIYSQFRGKTTFPGSITRTSKYLSHPVFNSYHSETELLRYIHRLQNKDLSLTSSMIPLGSCTMKLNATTQMYPVTWPEFGQIHPFAPQDQTHGYHELFKQLEGWLCEITGFSAVSLQPNAGSQGEYAGLLAIRKYHASRGEDFRNICLIPKSAHGTNPASAVMAGMKVVVVDCDSQGNVDLGDLRAKAQAHAKELSSAMITYPSTHGVFEETIVEFCDIIHINGGQVYMDGANMNAQVGLCRPGDFGPDVCHLNLHKTFCIPHGGGGPGMGPIGVRAHLAPFLPTHPLVEIPGTDKKQSLGTVSAAPWGSASILPISWAYIAMMGERGLRRATQIAILNANYMAKKLDPYFPVLYKGASGLVAHECIIDLRKIKDAVGVDVEDVAKRLMDYGFHAPTVSFPVAGTLMIEPTESESKSELDRFCAAMISIHSEIKEIESGVSDKKDNLLKNAPHTVDSVIKTEWSHHYSRERAAFPLDWVRKNKFWPSVSRVNGVQGDRNLICTCPSTENYCQ